MGVYHKTDMEFPKKEKKKLPGAGSGGGGGGQYELGESMDVRLGIQKGKKKKKKPKKKKKKPKKKKKSTNDLLKKVAGAFKKVKGKIAGGLAKAQEALHGKEPEAKKIDPVAEFKKTKFNGDWCSRMFDAGKQESEKKQAKKGKKEAKKKAKKAKKQKKKAN